MKEKIPTPTDKQLEEYKKIMNQLKDDVTNNNAKFEDYFDFINMIAKKDKQYPESIEEFVIRINKDSITNKEKSFFDYLKKLKEKSESGKLPEPSKFVKESGKENYGKSYKKQTSLPASGGKNKSKKRVKSRKNKRTRRAKNKRTKKSTKKHAKNPKHRKSRRR